MLDSMDVRHLKLLIEGLNPEGTLYRQMNPDWYWSWEEELLATIVELIDRLDRHIVRIFTTGAQHSEPIKVMRPKDQRKKFSGTTKAEFIQMVKRDIRGK